MAINYRRIIVLVILSYIFFMLGNGIINLTNPDEVFYTGTAKEMVQQKSWMVPYLFGQPQFEKPILTYWLLRIGFIFFGISNFGARFFISFFAMLGVIAVYIFTLKAYKDERKAFLSALILLSSGIYIGLARSVFTDMIFSVFILLSLVSFYLGYISKKSKSLGILFFFIFAGLAVLTKGPLGILLPFLAILLFLAANNNLKSFFRISSLWSFLIFLLICLPWYVFVISKFGNVFIPEFFYNDHLRRIVEAEHRANDTWYFYPFSMIVCMFPWSVYVAAAIWSFLKRMGEKFPKPINIFLFCWVLIVFAVFQIAHSKLVSYIFPLFPALAILTADYICETLASKRQGQVFIFSLISWFVLLSLPAALVINALRFPHYVPSRIPVYGFVFIYGILLAVMFYFILKRKSWVNIYLLSIQLLAFLSFGFYMHKNYDAYVCSKAPSEYLIKNYDPQGRILCSKFFARGVRFYTEKDIAVINVRGANYFSPHPVPYFDRDPGVTKLLREQKVTYGILKKSSMSDIERIAEHNNFKLEVLKVFGDEYVVRVQAVGL